MTIPTDVLERIAMVETEYKAVIRFQDAPKENVVLKTVVVMPLASPH